MGLRGRHSFRQRVANAFCQFDFEHARLFVDGGNAFFVDGHVQSMRYEELTYQAKPNAWIWW